MKPDPQPTETQPDSQTQQSQPKEKKSKNKWMKIIIGVAILLLLLLLGLGFLIFKLLAKDNSSGTSVTPTPTAEVTSTPTPTLVPTATPVPAKTGSEVVSLDPKYNQYNNYDLGFSIKYPKMPRGSGTCANIDDVTPSATQVIEDLANQVVYVSYKTQRMNGLNGSCQMKTVDLNLIKNGVKVSSGSYSGTEYPLKFAFNYKKVNSDSDMVAFADKIYFQADPATFECKITKKDLTNAAFKEYSIKFGSSAQGLDEGDTKCVFNFIYGFIYSQTQNLAVTYGIGQDYPFGDSTAEVSASFIH